MIQVEKLSYGFPDKDLYKDISFTLTAGQHCALIGSNGCGKSTLVDLLMHPDKYWFDGKVLLDEGCRIGYASQFSVRDKVQDCSVFDYLAERFTTLSAQISAACDAMAAPDLDEAELDRLFASYQALLDQSEAMDAEHYESAIRKQLRAAGMRELEHTRLADVSGGEYKLLQIMREMLLAPNLLVLDEPDVFLDFENLNGLCRLINGYPGTLLAVTHNRYLLQHCFNKILHLENTDLQEFDGTYGAYRCALLREKLVLRLQHIEEQAEIARTEQMVESLRKRATLMVNPTIGQAVNAKQSQLERLLERQIKAPFIEVREPLITLPEVTVDGSAASEDRTVSAVLADAGLQSRQEMRDCLAAYTLPEGALQQKVSQLSGGEQNLLQLAVLARSGAKLLLLDEPTSHLDLYAQAALARAVKAYRGTILMVTHDFYLAANCADYILLIEDHTVRRIRSRNFRKMVYDRYFDSTYLEIDRKKQELETAISAAFQRDDLTAVDKLLTQLEAQQ